MSKFDYSSFYGGLDEFAVSKEKYTKEEAINLARFELSISTETLCVGIAWVRYRFGVDEDGEKRSCWWLEYEKHKRSCEVWVFHIKRKLESKFDTDYEEINFS